MVAGGSLYRAACGGNGLTASGGGHVVLVYGRGRLWSARGYNDIAVLLRWLWREYINSVEEVVVRI